MSDLRISGVVKRFGQVAAVDGVDVHVQQGHLLSLLGPSGCGKTTLLRMIAGLEQPNSGSIAIGSDDITDVPVNQRGIGMVFQSYALFPNMTAAENIGYGLRLRKWSEDQHHEAGSRDGGAHPDRRRREALPPPDVGWPAAACRAGPGARHRAPGAAP